MNKQIPIWICIFILLVSSVSAVCTLTVNKASFQPGETVTAEMTCSTGGESGVAYSVVWNNGTAVVETDTGTTPSTPNTPFFETYNLPDVATYTNAFANLTGTALEGTDYFNVSGTSVNLLIINDAQFSPVAKIGEIFAVDFEVKNNGSLIDDAHCIVFGTDENEAPLQECTRRVTSHTINGRGLCSDYIDAKALEENVPYLAKIRCHCMIGDDACFNAAGTTIQKISGETTIPFIITPWLSSVNTITDKSAYTLSDDYISVCANVTNTGEERIPLNIYYNVRCGGNNNATDRAVLADFEEVRGISANTTQTQCALVEIKNIKTIQNKVNNCYAATTVTVLDEELDGIISYDTTSPMFTITSTSSVLTTSGDTMGSLAIMIFILLINGALFILPFKMEFTKNEWSNFAIKRGILVVAIYLMVMNSAIAATIAEVSGIPITKEMFRYMWFFGIAGWVSMLYLMFTSVLGTIKLWKNQQAKMRMGEE